MTCRQKGGGRNSEGGRRNENKTRDNQNEVEGRPRHRKRNIERPRADKSGRENEREIKRTNQSERHRRKERKTGEHTGGAFDRYLRRSAPSAFLAFLDRLTVYINHGT